MFAAQLLLLSAHAAAPHSTVPEAQTGLQTVALQV
jgi:hypothetical protein